MTTTTETTTRRTYTTVAEDSARIRAELKRRGISSRQVSVRSESYSMGSSIHVTIKVPGISKALVSEIATKAEHIDRDQWGEILCGGNRFVFVDFDRSVHAAHEAAILALLPKATEPGCWDRLDVTDWLVRINRHGMSDAMLTGEEACFGPKAIEFRCGSREMLARQMAEAVDA